MGFWRTTRETDDLRKAPAPRYCANRSDLARSDRTSGDPQPETKTGRSILFPPRGLLRPCVVWIMPRHGAHLCTKMRMHQAKRCWGERGNLCGKMMLVRKKLKIGGTSMPTRYAGGTNKGMPVPELMGHGPDQIRTWIRAVCRSAGITPTQLARSAGLPPATINRFLNATKGAPRNLNAHTIELLTGTTTRLLSPSRAVKNVVDPANKVGPKWGIRTIEVRGEVASSVWRAAPEWSEGERYLWPAPIEAAYAQNYVVGLEIADDSADHLYPPDTIVTCVPYSELGRWPHSGERVVAYRYDAEGKVEVMVREYFIDAQRNAWLLSRSNRPDVDNIPLGPHEAELPKHISIPYRVTGSFRPE
jgi:hypothetical protein